MVEKKSNRNMFFLWRVKGKRTEDEEKDKVKRYYLWQG